ncbi:MAG: glycosyl transferase family 1, partial [Nanoarchaeota archaeon]|nr:glycosyl transferase family 1 [Nanoarchaeota archaeon]
MKKNLEKYKKIVGTGVVEEINKKAKKFLNKRIVCISSTYQGGGVAEILNSIIFLFNEIGIKFGWRIIHGTPDFFAITKKFHNALQGSDIHLSKNKKMIYRETNRRFSMFNHLDHDLVIVHDPQPLPLIDFYKKRQPWIFRCHIDLSNSNPVVWNYLKNFIKKYDELVVSAEEYKKNLSISQIVIYPAIDPLSQKNCYVQKKIIKKYLAKNGIDFKKPIIAQISRYDIWKDPEGVIRIFDKVKKEVDCQLVLLGNMATDDPEGVNVYTKIMKKFGNRKDIKILVNVSAN